LGLKGEEAKPGFTQSAAIFMIKIMGLFFYLRDFPNDAGTVCPGIGYDLYSTEVFGY
jgi:hypothetical protein